MGKLYAVLICTLLLYTYGQAQDTIKADEFINRNGFKMVDNQYFPQIAGKYFSFIAAGHNIDAPLTNNFTLDVVDAKFSLTGAAIMGRKKRGLVNVSFSGDKDGNTATLFSDYKTGGNFTGELNFSYRAWSRFKFYAKNRQRVELDIRQAELNSSRYRAALYRSFNNNDLRIYETKKKLEALYAMDNLANLQKAYNEYLVESNPALNLALPDFSYNAAGQIDINATKRAMIMLINRIIWTNQTNPFIRNKYKDYIISNIARNVSSMEGDEFTEEYTTLANVLIQNGNAPLPPLNNSIAISKQSLNAYIAARVAASNNILYNKLYELQKIATYNGEKFIAYYNEYKKTKPRTNTVNLPPYNAATVRTDILNAILELNSNVNYALPYNGIDTVLSNLQKTKSIIYSNSEWSSIHLSWFSLKQKIGGTIAYTFKPDTLLPGPSKIDTVRASIKRNALLTYSVAAEANYYYWHPKYIAILGNFGIGAERSNNLYQFDDKRDYNDKISIKDSLNGTRTVDYTKKYSAYVDKDGEGVKSTWNLLLYANLYAMFGPVKAFGIHTWLEYRNNFETDATKLQIDRLGVGFGMVGNIPSKDGKSVVGIETYIKFGDLKDKGFGYNKLNEGQSEIGVTFNVPILSVPKTK